MDDFRLSDLPLFRDDEQGTGTPAHLPDAVRLVRNLPVSELNLVIRLTRALESAGYWTLEDLVSATPSQLQAIPQLGWASLQSIRRAVRWAVGHHPTPRGEHESVSVGKEPPAARESRRALHVGSSSGNQDWASEAFLIGGDWAKSWTLGQSTRGKTQRTDPGQTPGSPTSRRSRQKREATPEELSAESQPARENDEVTLSELRQAMWTAPNPHVTALSDIMAYANTVDGYAYVLRVLNRDLRYVLELERAYEKSGGPGLSFEQLRVLLSREYWRLQRLDARPSGSQIAELRRLHALVCVAWTKEDEER